VIEKPRSRRPGHPGRERICHCRKTSQTCRPHRQGGEGAGRGYRLPSSRKMALDGLSHARRAVGCPIFLWVTSPGCAGGRKASPSQWPVSATEIGVGDVSEKVAGPPPLSAGDDGRLGGHPPSLGHAPLLFGGARGTIGLSPSTELSVSSRQRANGRCGRFQLPSPSSIANWREAGQGLGQPKPPLAGRPAR